MKNIAHVLAVCSLLVAGNVIADDAPDDVGTQHAHEVPHGLSHNNLGSYYVDDEESGGVAPHMKKILTLSKVDHDHEFDHGLTNPHGEETDGITF